MADRMEREPVEPGAIGVGIGVSHIEVGHQRPGMSGRHAGTQA